MGRLERRRTIEVLQQTFTNQIRSFSLDEEGGGAFALPEGVGAVMTKLFSLVLVTFLLTVPAFAQISVEGTVTGFGGNPIPLARVFLKQPNASRIVASADADSTGHFRVSIPSKGVWLLTFGGVFHEDCTVAIYVGSPEIISLNVRLATCRYNKNLTDVRVIGNFNKWYPPDAVPMKRQPDGTFVAEVRSGSDSLVYQLSGVAERNIAGTESDGYVYDASHGYSGILRPHGGMARIVFDPGKLVRSDSPAEFSFSPSDSVEAAFARVYDRVQQWNREYSQSLLESARRFPAGEKGSDFDFTVVLSELRNRLEVEKSSAVRQELLLYYFMYALRAGTAGSATARRVLEMIPPSSAVWALAPALISRALDYSKCAEDERRTFVVGIIDKNSSDETISFLLSNEFIRSLYRGEKGMAIRYYDMAVGRFAGTPGGQEVARYHDVMASDTVDRAPAFSVSSMDNSGKTFTNDTFKGKYLLIYFWSPRNQRSVSEMKYLREAFRRYRRNSLRILTLSVDSSYSDLVKFRRERKILRWSNACVGKGDGRKIIEDFGVRDIPAAFLVDPHGAVVSGGAELQGRNLEKILRRYIRR